MGDDTKEWARNGSFMKKPATGWLHDDAALSNGDGVYYPVKYVGSIPMEVSMRTLRFEDRTAVTREAITLVSETAGIRAPTKRKVPKIVKDCITGDPQLKNLNVKLTVSTTGIALVVIETNRVIANHIMPSISFATGGDPVDYDIIGYVAKDARNARECHVFDCGHMAHDVMATIGQAFELRYKAFLKKGGQGGSSDWTDGMGGAPQRGARDALPVPPGGVPRAQRGGNAYGEVVYDQAAPGNYPQEALYDDLPENGGGGAGYGGGQFGMDTPNYGDHDDYPPPTRGGLPPPMARPSANTYGEGTYGDAPAPPVARGGAVVYGDETYDNGPSLVRGAAAPPPPRARAAAPLYGEESYGDVPSHPSIRVGGQEYGEYGGSIYDNKAGALEAGPPDYDDSLDDPFANPMQAPGARELQRPLHEETWFHGSASRQQADALLRKNGDFLVRETGQARGQYVLSAVQDGDVKHLLLVDPSGRVRTQDMTFDSVSHLINYHIRARIPIISRGARITLGQPVARPAYTPGSYESLPHY